MRRSEAVCFKPRNLDSEKKNTWLMTLEESGSEGLDFGYSQPSVGNKSTESSKSHVDLKRCFGVVYN